MFPGLHVEIHYAYQMHFIRRMRSEEEGGREVSR